MGEVRLSSSEGTDNLGVRTRLRLSIDDDLRLPVVEGLPEPDFRSRGGSEAV
jgi:hypothetical protein